MIRSVVSLLLSVGLVLPADAIELTPTDRFSVSAGAFYREMSLDGQALFE